MTDMLFDDEKKKFSFSTTYKDVKYHAVLHAGDKLCWSDGDIWRRLGFQCILSCLYNC